MTGYRWKRGAPKVAFVTGAASGLGQRFCQQLLAEGVIVAAFDQAFDAAARAALEPHAPQGGTLSFHTADVVDPAATEAAITHAISQIGAPDLLIHAAGILKPLSFLETSHADFTHTVDVNLHGTRNVVAAALPAMQAGSHLVLIASLAGITANYAYSSYCASKFGVIGLTEVLRMELIEREIDVSSVCPAEIVTPMIHAERQHNDPIRRRLKAFAGAMERDPACALIMRDIAARKPRIVPGVQAKFTSFMTRAFPAVARAVVRRMIRNQLALQRK